MFSFGGLATGLDTKALISGLMSIERLPLQTLQARQQSMTAAKSTMSDLLAKMAAIKTAAEDLGSAKGFASLVTQSNNPAVVATPNGVKEPGTFSVAVDQLAQDQRSKSNAFASSVTALGVSGNMDFTVGADAAVSISVAATDTLADIATKINQSDARVSASVINDNGQFRLLVRGSDTGASNAFSVAGSATLGLDVGANTYQSAQDAQITLDNQFTMTSASNKFTNVAGLDLAVTAVTSTPASVSVVSDSSALVDKIATLVEAYNDAASAMQSTMGHGKLSAKHKELAGDGTLRSALNSLSSTVSSAVAGLTGKYNMLASVGLHLTQGGKLELDEAKLEEALAADAGAVEKVFVGDPSASIDGAMSALIKVVDRFTDGDTSAFEVKIESMGDQYDRMTDQIERMTMRLDDYETRLQAKFTALELVVSKIQSQENALAGLINMSFKNDS